MQLMLNTILNKHFQNARCIIQMLPFPSSPFVHLSLSSANITVPQIINPSDCVTDCDHYIDDDPLLTISYDLLRCFRRNREYTFKGIIFLTNGEIEDYKTENFGLYNYKVPVYAGNAIFIKRVGDEFVISAFTNWLMKDHVMLNRWNIFKLKFMMKDENIDDFYSLERKKRSGGVLNIGLNTGVVIPVAIKGIKICLVDIFRFYCIILMNFSGIERN